MSRQNKVNPGMYTQRGRLSQDDIARELARQRSAVEPPHGWQAEQRHPFQPPELKDDNAEGGEQAAEPVAEPAKPANKRPARVTAKAAIPAKTARPAARTKTAAKTVKAKRSRAAKSAKTVKVKAKSARTAKSAKTAKPKARAKAKK